MIIFIDFLVILFIIFTIFLGHQNPGPDHYTLPYFAVANVNLFSHRELRCGWVNYICLSIMFCILMKT